MNNSNPGFLSPGKVSATLIQVWNATIRSQSLLFYRILRTFTFTFILLCITMVREAKGQYSDFPVPKNIPNQLFYLQRPANTNTIIYELNAENGVPDKKQPIHVYWMLYAKNGEKEALSDIENKYAYGVKVTAVNDNSFEFYLKAYKKMKLVLREGEDKQYHVYTTTNVKPLLVTRIFIAVKGGSLFKPKIDYVELEGIDTTTGATTTERISL